MKKVIALLLALTMVLALAACGAKEETLPTAEEVYTKMQEKNNAAGKYDADIVATVSADMSALADEGTDPEESKLNLVMTGEMKMEMTADKVLLEMPMTTEIPSLGTSITTNSYYADGYYMTDMAGEKYKIPMDVEDALGKFLGSDMLQTNAIELIRDLQMEVIEPEDSKSGRQYKLTFSMDPEKMSSLVESMGDLGVDSSLMNVEWGDMENTVLVDADYNVISQDMTTSYTITLDGLSIPFTMSTSVLYHEIPADFAVQTPDPAEFEELAMPSEEDMAG